METGGILRSAVLNEREQSQVLVLEHGNAEKLGEHGFASRLEVWAIYCAITGCAAQPYEARRASHNMPSAK
jgi:hypothetical protein